MKNNNNEITGNNNHVGDIRHEANNKGVSNIALLCSDIANGIYMINADFHHKIPIPFEITDKIELINNKIFKHKESLMEFWKKNEVIDKIIIEKTEKNPLYAGKIYGKFKELYIDNKYLFKDKENFGDIIIDFIIDNIKEEIKDLHDLKKYPVDDLHSGVRALTFHAFYKCKILENPNDS